MHFVASWKNTYNRLITLLYTQKTYTQKPALWNDFFIYFFIHGWKEMLSASFFFGKINAPPSSRAGCNTSKTVPTVLDMHFRRSREARTLQRIFFPFPDLKKQKQQPYFKECLTESLPPPPPPKKTTTTKLNKTKRLHIIFAENTSKKPPGARHSPKCRRHCVFSEAAEIISSLMVLYVHRNRMVYQGREKNGIGNEISGPPPWSHSSWALSKITFRFQLLVVTHRPPHPHHRSPFH